MADKEFNKKLAALSEKPDTKSQEDEKEVKGENPRLKRKLDEKEVNIEKEKIDSKSEDVQYENKEEAFEVNRTSEDVECKKSEASVSGLKKKISVELPNGEVWAAEFEEEEEESDLEDMSEDEAELRKELKWETWNLALAQLGGSRNSAHVAVGSGNGAFSGAGSQKSDFSAMDLTVQRAKMQAAQILMQARKIEEAYAVSGESADPDLVEMSAEVDKVGDLAVQLHELWNSRKGEEGGERKRTVVGASGCDKTRQSSIKAVEID